MTIYDFICQCQEKYTRCAISDTHAPPNARAFLKLCGRHRQSCAQSERSFDVIELVIAGLGLILDLSARPAHAERLPIKVYTSVSTDQIFNPQPEPPQPVRAL